MAHWSMFSRAGGVVRPRRSRRPARRRGLRAARRRPRRAGRPRPWRPARLVLGAGSWAWASAETGPAPARAGSTVAHANRIHAPSTRPGRTRIASLPHGKSSLERTRPNLVNRTGVPTPRRLILRHGQLAGDHGPVGRSLAGPTSPPTGRCIAPGCLHYRPEAVNRLRLSTRAAASGSDAGRRRRISGCPGRRRTGNDGAG